MEKKRSPSWLLATWFGLGYSPKAPGTIGTLGAVPVQCALLPFAPAVHWVAVALLTGVGVWAAQRVASDTQMEDPQIVVIDEVAGVLVAMAMVRAESLWLQALALVLFRVFDITKPGPISFAETLKPPGVGIMADDLLAGVTAGSLALAAAYFCAGG